MITVVLINEQPILRTGLSLFLQTHYNEINIFESESIITFQKLNSNNIPDIIMLGIGQNSDHHDLNQVNLIKKYYPKSSIILYDEDPLGSNLPDENLTDSSRVLNYLKAGVSGYLTKLNDLTDLLDCINSVLKGKRYISNEVFDVLLFKLPFKNSQSRESTDLLTSREYEIAKYLIAGLKTSEIAKKMGKKSSTISTAKTHIFEKLEVTNIVQLREIINTENK